MQPLYLDYDAYRYFIFVTAIVLLDVEFTDRSSHEIWVLPNYVCRRHMFTKNVAITAISSPFFLCVYVPTLIIYY